MTQMMGVTSIVGYLQIFSTFATFVKRCQLLIKLANSSRVPGHVQQQAHFTSFKTSHQPLCCYFWFSSYALSQHLEYQPLDTSYAWSRRLWTPCMRANAFSLLPLHVSNLNSQRVDPPSQYISNLKHATFLSSTNKSAFCGTLSGNRSTLFPLTLMHAAKHAYQQYHYLSWSTSLSQGLQQEYHNFSHSQSLSTREWILCMHSMRILMRVPQSLVLCMLNTCIWASEEYHNSSYSIHAPHPHHLQSTHHTIPTDHTTQSPHHNTDSTTHRVAGRVGP